MTEAEIRAATNAALDRVVVRLDRSSDYKGFPFKRFDEMGRAVPKRHLIKGVFARGETSAWIAPPGGMKSALLASAAISLASGSDWFGKRNKERCAVIFFALERADLTARRLQAQREREHLPNLPIVVVAATVNLLQRDAVGRVIATINEVAAEYGIPVGMIVFDTFAKLVAAAGLDEDKAKDQGAIFSRLQAIKDATDVHLAVIGHMGKDETRGARGSNAILGDVDLMVSISGDAIKTATVTKANDAPEGPLLSFRSEVHDFGTDEDGDPITVNVVAPTDTVEAPQRRDPKLTPNQRTMLLILQEAGAAGLLGDEWTAKTKEAGIGIRRRADITEARLGLKSKRLVREYQDRWHACS